MDSVHPGILANNPVKSYYSNWLLRPPTPVKVPVEPATEITLVYFEYDFVNTGRQDMARLVQLERTFLLSVVGDRVAPF